MSQHIVRKSVDIKATPAEVWEALTNPEKTKKYFFNCRVISSWKPGSPITFKGKMFWVFPIEMSGKIVQAEPQKILKYTLDNKSSGKITSTSTVTDELSFLKGVTTLSITDDVGSGEGVEKRLARSQKGWDKILRGLKDLVEGAH